MEEEEEGSFSPCFPESFHPQVAMRCGDVEHDNGNSADTEGEAIEGADDSLRRHALGRGESLVAIVPGYHADAVVSLATRWEGMSVRLLYH
jgi:hypothetical protein